MATSNSEYGSDIAAGNLDYYNKMLILRVAIKLGIFPNTLDLSTFPKILEKIYEERQEIYGLLVDLIKKHQKLYDFCKNNESEKMDNSIAEDIEKFYDAEEDEARKKLENVFNSIKTLPIK